MLSAAPQQVLGDAVAATHDRVDGALRQLHGGADGAVVELEQRAVGEVDAGRRVGGEDQVRSGLLDEHGLHEVVAGVEHAGLAVLGRALQLDRRVATGRRRRRVALLPHPSVPRVERLAAPEVGAAGLHPHDEGLVGAAPDPGVERLGEAEVAGRGAVGRPGRRRRRRRRRGRRRRGSGWRGRPACGTRMEFGSLAGNATALPAPAAGTTRKTAPPSSAMRASRPRTGRSDAEPRGGAAPVRRADGVGVGRRRSAPGASAPRTGGRGRARRRRRSPRRSGSAPATTTSRARRRRRRARGSTAARTGGHVSPGRRGRGRTGPTGTARPAGSGPR